MQEINFNKFVQMYRVSKRKKGDQRGSYLFAPNGADRMHILDQVKNQFKRFTVWTVCIENDRKIIKAGYRIDQTRVGHILSNKKWKNKDFENYIIK